MCLVVGLAAFVIGVGGTMLAVAAIAWVSRHAGKAGPSP